MKNVTHFNLTIPWVLAWILMPLLAYVLSWAAGIGFMLFFPPLLAVAQWLAIRVHPAEGQGRWQWLITVVAGYVIGLLLLQATGDSLYTSTPDGGQNGYAGRVFMYYAGQSIAGSFGLAVIFGQARWLYWLVGNGLAGIAWRYIFILFNLRSAAPTGHYTGDAQLFLLIPLTALFTNSVTAYALHLSLPTDDES